METQHTVGALATLIADQLTADPTILARTGMRMARTKDGAATNADSADACAWCVLGLVYRAKASPDEQTALHDRLNKVLGHPRGGVARWFEDDKPRGVEEVIALFRTAGGAEVEPWTASYD